MSSIFLGIAALVAINSFNYNLTRDIDRESAALLGADLVVTGNRAMGPNSQLILDSLPADKSAEIELLSMAFIPSKDVSQFVRIKALEGDFPYYGALKTMPPSAANEFRRSKGAVVDETMMLEQGLVVGDSIKLGNAMFQILGSLKGAFGSVALTAGFAPTIYIGKEYLDATDLVQPGSLLNYFYYYKLESESAIAIDDWKEQRADELRKESMRMETVSDRQANVGDAFSGLNNFLNLVALVALILGCIGVASSVFIYVKSKVSSIAIFRCLGMKGRDAFLIYFFQIFILGFISVLAGSLIGSAVQFFLPKILADFLPFEVTTGISFRAIAEGLIIGSLVTGLFAMIPLLSIRRISPMRTLRMVADSAYQWLDRTNLFIYLLILVTLTLFLFQMTADWGLSFAFIAGLSIAFTILFLMARLIMWFVQKFFPRHWNFELRQGISNLYRPNNQTAVLLVSIGLGTAVLTTLFIIQGLLLNNVSQMDSGDQPNMFLYGIETHQKDSIANLALLRDMPLIQQLPIVTMRLEGWKGRSKGAWLEDSTRSAKGWAIHRETRATYRDYLDSNEKILTGEFNRKSKTGDSIYISLGEDYAEAMDLELGDELEYNVQGARLKTYVGSTRKIDYANMRARFLVLFPTGVLENAPQFNVLVTKSPSPSMTADFRNEVVKSFPNVSVVDLGLVLETISEVLTKVSYIVRFMAVFCILTGLIVLLSSLRLSKFQRIKESVLLRTLGASRKQIMRINMTEYFLLGTLSALTGIIIAILASLAFAKLQMDLAFTLNWMPILWMFIFVVFFTVAVGISNSREIVNKPPLEVLRKEVG
jgi:putative ABC transport system permease protein